MRAGQLTRTGGEAAARRNERLAALVLTPTALRLAEASASAVEAALLTMLDLEEPKAGADRARRRAASRTADIGVMPYVVAVRA